MKLVKPGSYKRIAQSAETISAVTGNGKYLVLSWRWSQKSRPCYEYSRQIPMIITHFQPQSGIQNFIPNDQSMEVPVVDFWPLMLLLHGNLPSLMAANFQAL